MDAAIRPRRPLSLAAASQAEVGKQDFAGVKGVASGTKKTVGVAYSRFAVRGTSNPSREPSKMNVTAVGLQLIDFSARPVQALKGLFWPTAAGDPRPAVGYWHVARIFAARENSTGATEGLESHNPDPSNS